MKKGTKRFIRLLCCIFCIAFMFSMAPLSRAAGMMRIVIDDHVYTKVYNDMGALALTHWHYDYSEDKLTLENFGKADNPQTPIFAYPYSGSMTIQLNGNNYIKASREMAMIIIGHVTFTGSGTLTIISNDTYAIYTEYSVKILESANLNINGLAGITGNKGIEIATSGTINIHTVGKSFYTLENFKITQGSLNLSGTNGIYSANGNVFMSGGETDVLINSTSQAIFTAGDDSYIEWSANAAVYAGESSPGKTIKTYGGEKYFRASFSGLPKLNPPRSVSWDSTVIDASGTTNPVGRWSAVENATSYLVSLYYYNGSGYVLSKTFTVSDALSCNFGGYFTSYGKYYFSVKAIADEVNYISSDNSPRTTDSYYFSGEIESRYYVTLPESDYFKVIPENGTTVVYYGESYSFTVDVDPAYNQSEILVWANGARVALRQGKYTVDNVTENIVIKIADMSVNTYTVTLPEHEAYTIYLLPEYSTEVEYGGDLAFSVELSDIYLQSNLVVTANGEKLTPKYGIIYTINNITQDYTVEISGLVRDSYDVSFRHIDGTHITTQNVIHGDALTKPDEPVLFDGMTFAGWSLEDGTMFDFNTPVEGPITLYARFEAPKEGDTYLISNLEQLIWFRDEVNFGNTAINARLCSDISMNEGNYILISGVPTFTEDAVIWQPIGGYDYTNEENYVKFYEGDFDADGHTLSGFYISHDKMAPEASELGIFGVLASQASVKDLNVTLSNFDGFGNIGAIAGSSYGSVSGCSSSAVLNGVENVGGIVGESYGDVEACSFTGIVDVDDYTSVSSEAPIGGNGAGGIVGNLAKAGTSVSMCTTQAKVTAVKDAGGIVGTVTAHNCSITDSVNNSAVTAQLNAGGILGRSSEQAEITDCENAGKITALSAAGGALGNGKAQVTDFVNIGEISGETNIGGIAGEGELTVTKTINKGTVTAQTGAAAGFMAAGDINALYCYNTGAVSGNTYAAGFIASADSAVISRCHNYSQVTAPDADALICQAVSAEVTNTFYYSELCLSDYGSAGTKEFFYSGYAAYFMNEGDENPVWCRGAVYPLFEDISLDPFVELLEGEGTEQSPYLISDENELRIASILVNNNSGWNEKNYKLTADITISDSSTHGQFVPFGSYSKNFGGVFDGDGYTLSGFVLTSSEDYAALFRVLSAKAMVLNLNVSNFTVSGDQSVGAIAGLNKGKIENCNVLSSSVTGNEYVGGIVGSNSGEISYSINEASVSGYMSVGGIAGVQEYGVIRSCFNEGNISGLESGSSTEIGGIAGKNFYNVEYCGNRGNITADDYAGGITGIDYGTMYSVFNAGTVTATENYGAITGYLDYEDEPEICYYLEGTATGDTVIGLPQTADEISSALTAYALNNNGTEKFWAQCEKGPICSEPDGSNAVVYTVTFYDIGTFYYKSAVMHGGSAILPKDPVAYGYNFLYWDVPTDNVTGDIVTRAVYDRDNLLTFMPTSRLDFFQSSFIDVICGLDPEKPITVAQLEAQIANENIELMDYDMVNTLSPDETVTTGMSVSLIGKNNAVVHTAYVVIFGDVNCDGKVDEADVMMIKLVNGEYIYYDELNLAQQLAADVNRDGDVTVEDSDLLEYYLLKVEKLDQTAILY